MNISICSFSALHEIIGMFKELDHELDIFKNHEKEHFVRKLMAKFVWKSTIIPIETICSKYVVYLCELNSINAILKM